MPRALLLVAVLAGVAARTGSSATREAPSYSATSIVNSASNVSASLAPNTFVTIYGKNLAVNTRSLAAEDLRGNALPIVLANTGVTVYVNHIPAHVYYVSPTQINALIPSDAAAGKGQIQIASDGVFGPAIPITITASAPALFTFEVNSAIATHADGSLLTAASPGRAGEYIALYATGLGATVPNPTYGQIPQQAARLVDSNRFEVKLDGVPIEPARIVYAGTAPGFAGLYQVNVCLPASAGGDPEIRLQTADSISPAGIRLHVAAGER